LSVITRSPLWMSSPPLGETAATPTMTSSRAVASAVGMLNSLLPLPRGISGTSPIGNTSRRPFSPSPSTQAIATKASAPGTAAGAKAKEFSGTFNIVLLALRSVIASASRATKP